MRGPADECICLMADVWQREAGMVYGAIRCGRVLVGAGNAVHSSLAAWAAQTAHGKSPTKRNPKGFASGEG